jgi:hypothetical protein
MRIQILLFLSSTVKTLTKNEFKEKFFLFILFEGTFESFFKDKKPKRSHKTVGIKVLLLFLLDDRRIRIREAQKHVDRAVPDPEHWLKPNFRKYFNNSF